jgi:uncharacterized membrane protein (UPF0127 family)
MRGAWLALLVICCGGGPQLETTKVTLGTVPLTVEVADSEAERAKGLMKRDAMAEDHGMIFVYPDVGVRGFWMKDTKIPLSIAFLDRDGVIKRIADMKPFDRDRTSSLYPAKYAIEVNQGWFDRHQVKVGDTVDGLDGLDGT